MTGSGDGFNPRLPGGRRLGLLYRHTYLIVFQSTPSGGKATHNPDISRASPTSFNPRLPGGRRHEVLRSLKERRIVSIHAFRGEGDNGQGGVHYCGLCFNPRLPGGRRRGIMPEDYGNAVFQSTPSGGKATGLAYFNRIVRGVSIHAFPPEGVD